MNAHKKAVVLVNLGSPGSPGVPDVRSYLKEFLTDPCVITLPGPLRYALVYGIIAPFRAYRSSKLYSLLWREKGSPLIYHGFGLLQVLRPVMDPGTDLCLAMRYGKPSLGELLKQFIREDYNELLCIPLFPQFATSTTGSIIRLLRKNLKGTKLFGQTRVIPCFHSFDEFARIWQKKINVFDPADYDAIVFSYHGIPVKQAESAHPGRKCSSLNCETSYHDRNRYCYRAACFQTTRSIIRGMNVAPGKVHTAFQSRFGRNWLKPYTDRTLKMLAGKGKEKVLVVSPSFVADCLETEIEIGIEYRESFKKWGGKQLQLVPSLNSDPEWVRFLAGLIRDPKIKAARLPDFDPRSSLLDYQNS